MSLRSAWAPVAAPLAGKKRGAFFMPELGDEVLVAFEHGDFDHPFIIGFLWNGVDTPPETDLQKSRDQDAGRAHRCGSKIRIREKNHPQVQAHGADQDHVESSTDHRDASITVSTGGGARF